MKDSSQPRDPSARHLMMIAGVIWIAFAVFLLVLLVDYLAQGAGVQLFGDLVLFGFIDIAARLLIGWIHVLGILIASIICFSIGIGLCGFAVPARAKDFATERHLD